MYTPVNISHLYSIHLQIHICSGFLLQISYTLLQQIVKYRICPNFIRKTPPTPDINFTFIEKKSKMLINYSFDNQMNNTFLNINEVNWILKCRVVVNRTSTVFFFFTSVYYSVGLFHLWCM